MPILQPHALDRLGNLFQILAADNNIDVFRQPSSVRFSLLHIEISRQTADYAVLESCLEKCLFYPLGEIEEIIHPLLEKRIDKSRRHSIARHGSQLLPAGLSLPPAEPLLRARHVGVEDRCQVQRNKLRENQPANHDQTERLPRFPARAVT